MTWVALRSDVLADFDEVQQLGERAARVTCGGDDAPELVVTPVRRRRLRQPTPLEVRFLAELCREPRVSRVTRALMLNSGCSRKVLRALVAKRLVRVERLKNKRGTLLAYLVRGGIYE